MSGSGSIGGLLALFAAALVPLPSVAQTQTQGQASGLVRRSLDAGARGDCPADLMAPLLRGACLQQMPALGRQLAKMGPVVALEFLGIQTIPSVGPVEVYQVRFKNGRMVWAASRGGDGKLAVLWSHG
jgi:hypothetical protein